MPSKKWKNWITQIDPKTCLPCKNNHGKIYPIKQLIHCPEHPFCRCKMEPLTVIEPGTATNDGIFGADWYLCEFSELPKKYINSQTAKELGWLSWKGNLSDVAPGAMIGGDEFLNTCGKLPQKNGRHWIEADINYASGYRNNERIVFSNDGLIFVTYDHYETFHEIKGE